MHKNQVLPHHPEKLDDKKIESREPSSKAWIRVESFQSNVCLNLTIYNLAAWSAKINNTPSGAYEWYAFNTKVRKWCDAVHAIEQLYALPTTWYVWFPLVPTAVPATTDKQLPLHTDSRYLCKRNLCCSRQKL